MAADGIPDGEGDEVAAFGEIDLLLDEELARRGCRASSGKRTRSSVWPMRSPFESSAMAAKTTVAREAPSISAGERPAVESE